METLEEADRIRGADRAQALALYASLQHQIEVRDEERLLWICDQVAPTPSPELEPLLERVPEDASEHLRRAALHARATIAWYQGRGEDAEALWTQGLRFPGAARDRFWIRSCLNVAMVMQDRRCLFEPLVLVGMGERAAQAAGQPYLATFAALRRAELLLELGDLERATGELERARDGQAAIHAAGERRVISFELLSVSAALSRKSGDKSGALSVLDRQIEWLESYGHVEEAILAQVHMTRLELRFDLQPEERAAALEAFEAIPVRFDLGPNWTMGWERRLAELRLRHAAAEGRRDDGRRHARALLDALRREPKDSGKVQRAARLGRMLAREQDDAELAREAYELASQASLACVLVADRAERDVPELAEATPEDWYVLRAYRRRLEDEQRDLLDAVAADLKPGAPAFDLLVQDQMIRICAWCYRVRTTGKAWLPIAHFIPSDASLSVSHGICEHCAERYFPDGAAPETTASG